MKERLHRLAEGLTRRRVLGLAAGGVALVAIAAVALPEARDRRAPPIDPAPFETRHFDDAALPADLPCAEVLTPANAYLAYAAVDAALAAGTLPAEIAHLACFLPDRAAAPDAAPVLAEFRTTVFDADVLYGFLDRAFERGLRKAIKDGRHRDGNLAKVSDRYGSAALVAFERTGEMRFLELYRAYFDRQMLITDKALGWEDVYHGKVMEGWGATNLGKKRWVSHATHFGNNMAAATGFARVILTDPALSAQPEWSGWARQVIDYYMIGWQQFEADLRPAPGADVQWYWRPFKDKFEATNHVHMMAVPMLNAYVVTGDPALGDRLREILEVFEAGVTIHPDGTASWRYSPWFQVEAAMSDRMSSQPSEHTWKGASTVPFLYLAAKEGLHLSPEVEAAVLKTITTHVVAGPGLKLHVHPEGSRPVTDADLDSYPSRGAVLGGYHYAALADPAVEAQILAIVAASPKWFPGGWFGEPRLAASYAMLLAGTD